MSKSSTRPRSDGKVSRFVTVGRVTAPHGVAGEVRVLPLTDFPERFDGMGRVYVARGGGAREAPTPMEVQSVRRHKQFFLVKFEGVFDRDGADALRGALLQVPEAEVHPLPPDVHYVFQLVGLSVYTREGRLLGTLRDVLPTGANDVYVIERAGGGSELLVPALRHVVLDIDVEAGRIEVDLLPGLE